VTSGQPVIHAAVALPGTLNWVSCARKITMASPLTKPSITGCGTRRMNLPSRKTPASDLQDAHQHDGREQIFDAMLATSETITTASAPVAPEIMPGRPPRTR
jgi:hypothetical protein